jgi:DNA-binding NarL/FixJ family response regulator
MVKRSRPKILIVEDEISVSLELQEMLTEHGYDVVGIADSGEEAIVMARSLKPDLALMDIKLSGKLDGIEAAARIRSRLDIPSVFLTGHGKKELVDRAVKADPLGYIMKPLDEIQILAAVKVALGKKVREESKKTLYTSIPTELIGLSAQQLRVADMVCEGKENSEIAKNLGITTNTVNWHRKRIRNSLGIKNTKADLMVVLRSLNSFTTPQVSIETLP